MISNIDTAGIGLDLGEDIKKYITKKIGRLDKYIPRHARKTARAQIKMRATNNKQGNKYECEVLLFLPGGELRAADATLNMFAAVDIVETKLRNQLAKYKEAHLAHLQAKYPGFWGKVRVHLMK